MNKRRLRESMRQQLIKDSPKLLEPENREYVEAVIDRQMKLHRERQSRKVTTIA